MDKKKEEKSVFEALGAILLIGFLVAAWPSIYAYFNKILAPIIGPLNGYLPVLQNIGTGILNFAVVLSIPLSLFFLIGIIYCVEGLKHIRKKEAEKHDLHVEPAFEDVPDQGNRDLSVRWEKVTSLLASPNENDWKQAILEADIMLEDVLTGLGYQGNSIGERLKRVQPGEFKNVQEAWDAHKVRNDIAHSADFKLTHHDANETIQKFRRVFEEFYTI